MASFKVRKYSDEDEEVVKEIFALGMREAVPSSFMHILKQPTIQIMLICIFFVLLAIFNSFLAPVLVITMFVVGIRQLVSRSYTTYINTCLKEDFSCIKETTMQNKDSGYWVAEREGQVVGLMAYVPSTMYKNSLELKHMFVHRSHRRQGIAKALCKVAVDFAHANGYRDVVLFTSVVQADAEKLYEHMGFKKIRQFRRPTVTAKFTNFFIYEHKLKVQKGRD